MILDGCGWFCLLADGLQMVLGRFRWFSVIYSFSSEGEIRCLKVKRSRQLWEVFVVHNNNDAKVFVVHSNNDAKVFVVHSNNNAT